MAHHSILSLLFYVVLYLASCVAGKQSPSLPPSLDDLDHRLSKLEHKQSEFHKPSSKDTKFYHFVSRPDIGAPRFNVKIHDQDSISPGYWFVAPYAALEQIEYKKWNGPHIYDGTGELVWSGAPMFNHYNTYDFRTVEIDGQQMASLVSKKDQNGVILDGSYQLNRTVDMIGNVPQWILDSLDPDEHFTNMHEFNVIEHGRRVLMLKKVWENATIEESRAIGFDGNCTAKWQGFKEVDMATGKPIFEWSSHGRIGLEESTKIGHLNKDCNGNLGKGGWDILHLNAVDKFPDGDYLLSSRHTDTLYKISHRNGEILWRLGGVKSDFEFLGHAKFSRQHHARAHEQNETHTIVSVFDNARGEGKNEHPTSKSSRGLVLSLRTDTNPMTAEILAEYEHPLGQYTPARGSVQLLPNKNTFICWSGSTRQTEHSPDGRLLLETSFKHKGANSYRSYKFPWVGRPLSPPDVHSVAGILGLNGTITLVHVSWNGATEVATWNMYKTDADGTQEVLVASIARQGFETALSYPGYASFVILEALDADGKVLGRSNIEKTIPPKKLELSAVIEETQWLQDHTSDIFASETLAALHNPAVMFFIGASSCVATIAVFWACWRTRKNPEFWNRSQKPAYERLSHGDEEGKEFIDQDDKNLGDESFVDGESDISDKTMVSSVRSCSPA